MSLVNNLVVNAFSIVLLIIIYTHSSKQDRKGTFQSRIYMLMLQITILLLVLDIFSRFDGKPDTIYPFFNYLGNFLIFMLNPILPSLWLLYVNEQVNQGKERRRRLLFLLIAINGANMFMVMLSQLFGWFYYIDSNNIYHRGSLFFLLALITLALIFAGFVMLIANHKKIEKRHYFSLVFFAVPPLVSIVLQIVFYGMSLMLNSIALSLLIVFLNIQNHNIYTDYLTGVYNRKKLEIYLNEKISESAKNSSFSAIMADLDNFKTINDTFGHDMGDKALQISLKILKSNLRPSDFVARFGGDEFCIVLDVSHKAELEQIVCRINNGIEQYNKSSEQPFNLGFSMGYAVYDYRSDIKMEEFLKQIDLLMYKNKQAKRCR